MPSDTDYLAAVKAGDTQAAQQMVDQAAKAAGAMSFDAEYPTYSALVSGVKAGKLLVHARELGEGSLSELRYGLEPAIGKTLSETESVQTSREYGVEPVELVFASEGFKWVGKGRNGMVFLRKDGFQKSLGNGKVQLPDGTVVSYEMSPIADYENEALRSEPAGVETGDWYSTKTADVVGVSPFNEKSADPITRDDSGNVIPLSQRFQQTSADIRYMPQPDPSVPGAYSVTGGFRILPGKTGGRLRVYGPSGALVGITGSLDEAQRMIRRKNRF